MLAISTGFELAGADSLWFLFAGVAIAVAIGALSHAHERAFSASMIYLGLGALTSVGLELLAGGQLLDPVDDQRIVKVVTEAALVLALFAAGLRTRRAFGFRAWASPLRLLGIAMPLTIAGVAAFGSLAMGLSLGAAIALGATLAPTDPVLAGDLGAKREGDDEPEESEAEFALTTEAGLNDGLAIPFLLLGILVARHDGAGGWIAGWVALDVVYKIAAGIALGAVAGHLLGLSTTWLRKRELLVRDLDGWLGVASPLLVYGIAETVSSYGFLAAFAAGIAFRREETQHREYNRRVHEGAETIESFAELVVVLLLGSMITIAGLERPGLWGFLLVPVLLLVLRPASVAVALAGVPFTRRERAWISWLGVKGVASLNYLAIIVAAGSFGEEQTVVITWTVIVAVAASIVVHGTTASALSRRWL